MGNDFFITAAGEIPLEDVRGSTRRAAYDTRRVSQLTSGRKVRHAGPKCAVTSVLLYYNTKPL